MKLAEFQKVGQMLAKEHRITINEGEGWAANIKRREVFYRKEDIYSLSEEHILGLLLHEVSHIHYTTDVTLPTLNQELMQSTLNMIEDIAIEHIIGKDYPNAGEILDQTRTECLDTLVQMLPKMTGTPIHEKALLYAATRFDGRGYLYNLTQYEKLGDEIATIMKRDESVIYERKETKDLVPLATEIVNLLIKELGDLTPEQKRQMKEGGLGSEEGKGVPATAKLGAQTAKQKIINGLKAGRGWKQGPSAHSNLVFIDSIADQASRIGKQLRGVLKRNNAMEFGGRYRTGKLLTKRFVRIKAMKDRRPFARRIIKSNQSYAFAVASDISGSMFPGLDGGASDPGSFALSSMHMVAEALRIASVPRSMIVFGERALTLSPMNKAQLNWVDIAAQSNFNKVDDGGTSIHLAIDQCVKELSTIRAERKILIVLTDGSSDRDAMKESHKKAKDAGIEPLGITVGDYAGKQMTQTFGKDKNIIIPNTNNPQDIGHAFIKILKKSIADSPQT